MNNDIFEIWVLSSCTGNICANLRNKKRGDIPVLPAEPVLLS